MWFWDVDGDGDGDAGGEGGEEGVKEEGENGEEDGEFLGGSWGLGRGGRVGDGGCDAGEGFEGCGAVASVCTAVKGGYGCCVEFPTVARERISR